MGSRERARKAHEEKANELRVLLHTIRSWYFQEPPEVSEEREMYNDTDQILEGSCKFCGKETDVLTDGECVNCRRATDSERRALAKHFS